MTRWPVYGLTLVDLRWQILAYGGGMGLYVALIALLFPTVRESFEGFQYPEEILQFLGSTGSDLTDPATFFSLEVFSLAGVIVAVYSIVAGTSVLAGEEGRGSLEVLLAQPVSRSRLMLEKTAAAATGLLGICILFALGWLAVAPFIDFEGKVTALDLAGATLNIFPLASSILGIALLAGAVAPTRGMAAGIVTVGVIAAYLLTSIARIASVIEWTQYLSPFYYSDMDRALTTGPVWWHQALLLGVAAVSIAIARRAFIGREVGAGTWQWRALIARAA